MQALLPIVFKSVLLSGIMYLYYMLFLRGKKLYVFNRFYLLASVILSLTLPCMSFEWYTIQAGSPQTVSLLSFISKPDLIEQDIAGNGTTVFSFENVVVALCVLTSVILLVTLIARIVWVYRLRKGVQISRYNGVEIVQTEVSSAPFSFMKTIYWKRDIDINTKEGQLIFRHELCHIEQWHTLDKLFMQLALIVAWVNPVFWSIRKELSLQHEFIADEAALEQNDTDAFARMILRSQYGNVFPDIVHTFFHSSIKRRLMMLNKTNKTKFSFLRRVMVLPIAAAAVFFLSFKVNSDDMAVSKVSNYDMPVERSAQKIVVVFDAGHGGKDNGAEGLKGLLEKDINLKICKKLQMLAGEYNIDARMTRNDDSYPTLTDRTNMANALRPDLFVSIHVNAGDEGEAPLGYEVIVSEKNAEIGKSKLLASAVSARLTSLNIESTLVQRGVHVLKASNCPAILIECGNIQSKEHVEMLTDSKKLESFCRHILSGIVDHQSSK